VPRLSGFCCRQLAELGAGSFRNLHYGAKPSSNTPRKSNENGSVEKSHDLLKKALDQRLRLRGSRDFPTRSAYEDFFKSVIYRRNKDRKERLAEELKLLKELPRRSWNEPQELFVSVSPWSTVTILRSIYSVPSRLVGAKLRALVHSNKVELYFGKNRVQEMVRVRPGETIINYRHVIGQLVRKPGAFKNYRFRDELFPSKVYRTAFDRLKDSGYEETEYLRLLHLAAMEGESKVEVALGLLLEMQEVPSERAVKELLYTKHSVPDVVVLEPNLGNYDHLLASQSTEVLL